MIDELNWSMVVLVELVVLAELVWVELFALVLLL
jgi:hypothetical protein